MPFFQKIKNEFVDVGQNIKNAFAPNSKPKAEAKVLSDGSVTHNVDLSEYKGGERAKAEQLIEKTAQAIHTYESKAAEARANGDGELAKHYDAKKLETEEAFTQLKWELEHRDLDVWHALALVGGLGVVLARAPDLQDRIVEGEEVVAHLVDVDAAGATRVGEGAGADGTGKPEGAFGALGGKSPEELAARLDRPLHHRQRWYR